MDNLTWNSRKRQIVPASQKLLAAIPCKHTQVTACDMLQSRPQLNSYLALKFEQERLARAKNAPTWWAPIWRGLLVDPTGKHYRAMHTSIWLYLYLIIHADRKTGKLFRVLQRIAQDMGVGIRTVHYWLGILRRHGYVTAHTTGRALEIAITKWRPLRQKPGW